MGFKEVIEKAQALAKYNATVERVKWWLGKGKGVEIISETPAMTMDARYAQHDGSEFTGKVRIVIEVSGVSDIGLKRVEPSTDEAYWTVE